VRQCHHCFLLTRAYFVPLLSDPSITDAPIVYSRRNCFMTPAHAGLLNGGVCLKKKDPLVGWDDCAVWSKLENVVIDGGGTLDANADAWYTKWGKQTENDNNQRPVRRALDSPFVHSQLAISR
jgi:hypothetical protein